MSYAAQTVENPSLLKRFSHGRRFDIALELLNVKNNDEILDFGTGDGFMLKKLLSAKPQSIVGYEPMLTQYEQLEVFLDKHGINDVSIVADLSFIENRRFDKICCLEVLEHLQESDQLCVLNNMKNLLKKDGMVVVSVPIEIGFSGLLKNLARYALSQQSQNATLINVMKSFFGIKIDRGQESYLSHIGFNYYDLEKIILLAGYKVKMKRFSPFKTSRGLVNSQIFFVLEPD